MEDAERLRLLGKYRTPRFRVGQRVLCQVRGEMVIRGMTDAPIPWPLGSPKGRGGRHSLTVYKDLAKAVRRESEQAVCHWFGVRATAVWKWRKALGVGFATEGTTLLFREHIAEIGDAMRALGVLKARDPERRRKIAEARRGKPRPPHVREAVRSAHFGVPHTEETGRRMSQTHRQRGTLVPGTAPWTAKEDELVKTLRAEEAARRTGRSLQAVYARRSRLQVPDGRRRT